MAPLRTEPEKFIWVEACEPEPGKMCKAPENGGELRFDDVFDH